MFNRQANESTQSLFIDFALFAFLFIYWSYNFYNLVFSQPNFGLIIFVLAIGIVASFWRACHYFRKLICKFIPCSV